MSLPAPNYDEALVPDYQLPELLRSSDGAPIGDAEAWRRARRPELLELFREHVYGRFEATCTVEAALVVHDAPACGGLGRRSELDVRVARRGFAVAPLIRVLAFVPAHAQGPVPALLGLNLFGNQTVHPTPAIRLAEGWLPENVDLGLHDHRAGEASRGVLSGQFGVEMLLSRGYALITAYAGDLDPDFDDGFENGLHGLLTSREKSGDSAPGTIAAWAFGLSRILDALPALPSIDVERVAVFGHSRLGKAALWAAAQDERFASALSNGSGCGGAALSRRCFGERLLHINRRFPHWFCRNFRAYDEREHELPVDQHQLLALIAPRPLYVASAQADLWADPRGELLALCAASPAYELFGLPGRSASTGGTSSHLGYHVRPGKHDLTPRDMWHFLDFADRHLRR